MAVVFDRPEQHDAFEEWKAMHPDGRVLNFGHASISTIHRPSCPTLNGRFQHPKGAKGPQSRTSNMKVCGENEADVRKHVSGEMEAPVFEFNECNRRVCRGVE